MSASPHAGLKTDYATLIQRAFQPQWWNSGQIVTLDANGQPVFASPRTKTPSTSEYKLMEFNFSLFWGIAIQMYEATLVANDSRVDQYLEGQAAALTDQELLGMGLFQGKGGCIGCHGGAETTN